MSTDKYSFDILEINQMLLDGGKEIIGKAGLQAVINIAQVSSLQVHEEETTVSKPLTASDWGALRAALEALFGFRGAYGAATRIGQVFFREYFRTYGLQIGMMDRNFRMQPKPKKIRSGLEILAEVSAHLWSGFHVDVIDDAENWFWQLQDCSWCKEDPGNQSILICFIKGVLGEFLTWVSGGKYYPIREVDKAGDDFSTSVIQIRKKYLG
ncbi:MAG: hypothetical protein MUO76_20135 [Anaerolineaceae bacterium]|jgi:hypothetical protein|nr:hypothetical protein [Anaerolineaceae bacterium]